MITHNSFANTATCVSFLNILWSLLSMRNPTEPTWWIETFCSVAQQLEGNTQYNANRQYVHHQLSALRRILCI